MSNQDNNDKMCCENEIYCHRESICGICYEEIYTNESCELKCNHIFHKKCIENMFNYNLNSCPICRSHIDDNPVDKFKKYESYYDSLKSGFTILKPKEISSLLDNITDLCNNDFIKANILLGDIYIDGIIVEKNISHAIKCYEKAVNEKSDDALFKLGVLYCELNEKQKGYSYLDVAAKNENVQAQFIYGCSLFNDICESKNFSEDIAKKAFNYLYKSSESNIVESFVNVGLCYFFGIGTDKNNINAFEFFKKSSMFENVDGLYYTGFCMFRGIGVKADILQARNYFERVLEIEDNHRNTIVLLKEINSREIC